MAEPRKASGVSVAVPSATERAARRDQIISAFRERDARLADVNERIEDLEQALEGLGEEYDEHPWPSMRERINAMERELESLYDEREALENNITERRANRGARVRRLIRTGVVSAEERARMTGRGPRRVNNFTGD